MKITLSLLFAMWLIFPQAEVIDHRHISTDSIPPEFIETVKQNCKFQWCGQSHGHQVLTGLKLAELDDPLLDVTVGDGTVGSAYGGFLPDSNGTFCVMDGIVALYAQCGECCTNWIAPANYWDEDGPLKLEKTFNCYSDINISGWVWCTELNYFTETEVQYYFERMESLEEAYPDVQFIYATGTTEYTGDAGYNRWLRNNQIRQYCIDNNKILLDFADIECWYEGDFSFYIHTTGDAVPTRHPMYPDEGYHHTNYLNCANKGRAIWNLMANLQGWHPCPEFNYATWSQQVGRSGENLESDCNCDNQVDNKDKNMFDK